MSHNIDLPRHRYVHVMESAVMRAGSPERTLPCVWWGISATPGRMFGCHILMESGAVVVDLPLHALRHHPEATHLWRPSDAQRWDAYGWHVEAHEPAYLAGLGCRVLSPDHRAEVGRGALWFYLDHGRDGYSLEPGQHKHHWVVALENGAFTCIPQDMMLVEESSFTVSGGIIPPVKRQSRVWTCE
jgi:hypothetical protein